MDNYPTMHTPLQIRDRLKSLREEVRLMYQTKTIHARDPKQRKTLKKLQEHDLETIDQTMEMLQVLDTEQFRQRTGFQTFLQGQLSRAQANQIVQSWNTDPNES